MRKTYLPRLCFMTLVLVAGWVVSSTPAVRAGVSDYPITVGEYIDSGATTKVDTSKIKLVVNSGANNTLTRGLIQLPALPNIPASQIVSAKILLDLTYDSMTNPSSRGVNLFPLTQSFSAGAASWAQSNTTTSTAWSPAMVAGPAGGPSGAYDSTNGVLWNPMASIPSPFYGDVWCSWDITNLWGNSNLLNNGAVLMFDQNEAQAPTSDNHYTIQFGTVGKVEVVTTPEPETWMLLLSGGSAAALAFRRRRNSVQTA
jgi:hypothetical protein